MSDEPFKFHLTEPHKITIYQNGKQPKLYYYFRWNNEPYRGATGYTQGELLKAVEVATEAFHDAKRGIVKGKRKNVMTFEKCAREFLSYKHQQVANGRLSQRTLTEYERQVEYLIECFGKRDIQTFGGEAEHLEYQQWRSGYYDTRRNNATRQAYYRGGKLLMGRHFKKEVGAVSIDKEGSLLVSVLRYSQRKLNVLEGKTIHSYEKIGSTTEKEILDDDEYQRMKEYWLAKEPYYWKIQSFIRHSGLRFPNEVLGLKISHIDIENERMTIQHRKRRGTQIIPLIGRAKEIIIELITRPNIPTGTNDYVFINDEGVRVQNITKAFKKSLVACGINKNTTMYCYRHLFTTKLIETNMSLKQVADFLGHKSTDMAEKIYYKYRIEPLILAAKEAEAERLIRETSEAELQAQTQFLKERAEGVWHTEIMGKEIDDEKALQRAIEITRKR